jgi:hypothetical protein
VGTSLPSAPGLNFVRSVVEGAGCLLKEINLQHDFGHDATMMLVVNGEVRPRESRFRSSPALATFRQRPVVWPRTVGDRIGECDQSSLGAG